MTTQTIRTKKASILNRMFINTINDDTNNRTHGNPFHTKWKKVVCNWCYLTSSNCYYFVYFLRHFRSLLCASSWYFGIWHYRNVRIENHQHKSWKTHLLFRFIACVDMCFGVIFWLFLIRSVFGHFKCSIANRLMNWEEISIERKMIT